MLKQGQVVRFFLQSDLYTIITYLGMTQKEDNNEDHEIIP